MSKVIWNSIKENDAANFSEKGNVELFCQFVAANGITGWCIHLGDPDQVAYTLKKKSGHLCRANRHTNIHFDHGRMYKLPNNERLYVCHPYLGDKVEEFKTALCDWANENGFVAEVYDPTFDWYYHSNNPTDFDATSLVVVHLPDTKIHVAKG